MKKFPPLLWLALGAALALTLPARAANDDQCLRANKQASQCLKALAECREQKGDREQALEAGAKENARLTTDLGQSRTALSNSLAAEESLCTQMGEVTRAVLGHAAVPATVVAQCVSPEERSLVDAAASSWAASLKHLQAVRAFETGTADQVPPWQPVSADSELEPLVADLGPQRTYRRLLVAALERIAPRFWRALRGRGDDGLAAWFASRQPLDTALVKEAQSNPAVPPSSANPLGAVLPAAAKAVQVYVDLAACASTAEHAPVGDCGRALQLQELLETSGPLVLRRRQQMVWETECSAASGGTLGAWLGEFSTIQEGIRDADRNALYDTVMAKLYACYLSDDDSRRAFLPWLDARLPRAATLSGAQLQRLDRLRARLVADSPMDLCLRAAHALKRVPTPQACTFPPALKEPLDAWVRAKPAPQDHVDMGLSMCAQFTQLLWEGKRPFIPVSFARQPTSKDLVHVDEGAPGQAMAQLRQLCADRRGLRAAFPGEIALLGTVAQRWGEPVDAAPWRIDAVSHEPVESLAYDRAATYRGWLQALTQRHRACDALGLTEARCNQCGAVSEGIYDCALLASLRAFWEACRQRTLLGAAAALLTLLFAEWSRRTFMAWRHFAGWAHETQRTVGNLGLTVLRDRWRWLLPSRWQIMRVALPNTPAWSRWGQQAVILRTHEPSRIEEGDVHRASSVAREANSDLVFLTHAGTASPQLGAIRAMLEWASKGAKKAVHVMPLSFDRLHWARSSDDLLELTDQASLRGNPFEVRGRLTSSSQFFNRERLVSGLLAGTQAGQWQVVTGLRRYGKSSLALEVARRLPGPTAYVDLTGFFQPIALSGDVTAAADAVLRYLCSRLYESATQLYPNAVLPHLPEAGAGSTTVLLADWYTGFVRACVAASPHRMSPMLVILDEIEQVLTGRASQLRQELDAFAAIVGSMRSIFGDPLTSRSGARVGVMFCSALHPFLWAPMSTLAGQSLMGAFQSAYLPRLSDEAVVAMMRSLGGPQGIRFSDAAIAFIAQESQGIPLLVRRLGASVLELYDVERAREGTLGAVDIGIEGARAAVQREQAVGSALRGWVESEIADPRGAGGQVLRWAAPQERVTAAAAHAYAADMIGAQLAAVGLGELLPPHECTRRAQEAAGKVVEALCEAGLLAPQGDHLNPEAYVPTDGLVRRILLSQAEP